MGFLVNEAAQRGCGDGEEKGETLRVENLLGCDAGPRKVWVGGKPGPGRIGECKKLACVCAVRSSNYGWMYRLPNPSKSSIIKFLELQGNTYRNCVSLFLISFAAAHELVEGNIAGQAMQQGFAALRRKRFSEESVCAPRRALRATPRTRRRILSRFVFEGAAQARGFVRRLKSRTAARRAGPPTHNKSRSAGDRPPRCREPRAAGPACRFLRAVPVKKLRRRSGIRREIGRAEFALLPADFSFARPRRNAVSGLRRDDAYFCARAKQALDFFFADRPCSDDQATATRQFQKAGKEIHRSCSRDTGARRAPDRRTSGGGARRGSGALDENFGGRGGARCNSRTARSRKPRRPTRPAGRRISPGRAANPAQENRPIRKRDRRRRPAAFSRQDSASRTAGVIGCVAS